MTQSSKPSRLAVLKALNRFLDASSEEMRALLERDQALLLTGTALQILNSRIQALQESEDWRQLLRAQYLEFHRTLLQRARLLGIAGAWQELEAKSAAAQQEHTPHTSHGLPLFAVFSLWVKASLDGQREERRFLEKHLALLHADEDEFLEQQISEQEKSISQIQEQIGGTTEQVQEIISDMYMRLEFLRTIRRRGTSIEAIRQAYVERYGGLTLDIPEWLENILPDMQGFDPAGEEPQLYWEQKARIVDQAIKDASKRGDVPPEAVAQLRCMLATVLLEAPVGNKQQAYEEAIASLEYVLQIYTYDTHPQRWALTHMLLANAYRQRRAGVQSDNLVLAIASLQEVLRVHTREALPPQWANLQENLASMYAMRSENEGPRYVEQALEHYRNALEVYTYGDYPEEWAHVQRNLGKVYRDSEASESKTNLELSLQHLRAALKVYQEQTHPMEWADVLSMLGLTYLSRAQGERRANLEEAITCQQAALHVFTRERTPQQWAKTQNYLGKIYVDRLDGEPAHNHALAIDCCKKALEVFSYDPTSLDYAEAQYDLGNAYFMRSSGDRRENMELAIACHEEALKVYTKEQNPEKWAGISSNLGTLYVYRIEGERLTNLEQAIASYEEVLEVYTLVLHPYQHARALSQLAIVYDQRLIGDRGKNCQKAVELTQEALQVLTLENYPREWAMMQRNLAQYYLGLREGDPEYNQEQAIKHNKAALRVYPVGSLDWALTKATLGNIYQRRLTDQGQERLAAALAAYDEATSVLTRKNYPREWADLTTNRAFAYWNNAINKDPESLEQCIIHCEAALEIRTLEALPEDHRTAQALRGMAYADLKNWAKAHEAFAAAQKAERLLLSLGTGVIGHDIVLAHSYDASLDDAYALLRLGQVEKAVITLELGRARSLAESLALNKASPEYVQDLELRQRYATARQHLINAQAIVNTSSIPRSFTSSDQENQKREQWLQNTAAFQKASQAFKDVVEEIQKTQPEFLNDAVDAKTILQIAEQGGAGHALVYLAATPWGGIALAAMSASSTLQTKARIHAVDLPALTESFVHDLGEVPLKEDTRSVIGGFYHAQGDRGMMALLRDWSADSFRAAATSLHQAVAGRQSTLDAAAQKVLSVPELAVLCDKHTLSGKDFSKLSGTLDWCFLQYELERCLPVLRDAIFSPLIAWLVEEGVTSLTLIPCGSLAAFPLTAVPLSDGQTVGDKLAASIAPSARALLREQQSRVERKGVYAIGNPLPKYNFLAWGEAEALSMCKIARQLGLETSVKIQDGATRSWLSDALRQGYVVAASCHGKFTSEDFRNTALMLARGQVLRLGELLSHEVDLRGLRLLILSACQTAILDLKGAISEVRSLAAGVLQSGAQAALASLWSVDDRATYLLMIRFAQEWFPKMKSEAPAKALARAQHWLRTVTNRELQEWEVMTLPVTTEQERFEAGVEASISSDEYEEEQELIDGNRLAVVRGRGKRYTIEEAEGEIRVKANQEVDLDACPYADPIYWAAFQITGW
jgi:CHAT domain-containing protein/tetratricopeptide (TPR) repeat protein